jgi:thioredoxin 1
MKEILYFSAPWCGPCKHFKPIMEQVGQQIPVVFINVDENPQIATQYGIKSVPTLIFLKNNEIVNKSIGVLSESQVKDLWNQN